MGNHTFTADAQGLRVVLGSFTFKWIRKLPRRKMYRKQADEVYNHAVANAISRSRFLECLKYFRFSNNLHLDTNDRYAKVKPFFIYLNKKYLLHFPTNNFLSVDETKEEYCRRHG